VADLGGVVDASAALMPVAGNRARSEPCKLTGS
jgi:hypothetical protein